MNDIMEKTYLLIDELDNSDIIHNITLYKNNIMNNKELRKLIDEANKMDDEYKIRDIKLKSYEYDDYKNYMHYYNELSYIIMDINKRFRELVNDKGCFR